MVWRPSDTCWRAAGTALSGSFTSSQRSAVGGGRSLRADTTRCSTCRETSLHCCCSGRNVPETHIRTGAGRQQSAAGTDRVLRSPVSQWQSLCPQPFLVVGKSQLLLRLTPKKKNARKRAQQR